MSRCIGCGSKIQTINANALGYVSEIALIERGENVYCQRCYGIKHHNLKYFPENNLEEYYNKIRVIKDEQSLVILIIDVMDVMGGFIKNLKEFIGDNKVIIIVNKIDVLPKDLKLQFIENFVRMIAKENKINLETVYLGSVKNSLFIEKIVNKINKLKYSKNKNNRYKNEVMFKNCYVIGCASVGKSTFMNQIGKMYLNFQKDIITTSSQFQTTIDLIKWPLDKNSFIIDTPGIVNSNNFGAYLDYESVNVLMPKKYIKTRTYQLNPDQTIFMGGLVAIKFSGNDKINASFYVSNELYIHRTKSINAAEFKKNQMLKMLTPPFTVEEYDKIKKEKTISFHIDKQTDIFISGLGFVHLVSKDANVEFTLFEKIKIKMLTEAEND